MALVPVTGNLSDIAGGDLSEFAPILKFELNETSALPGGTIVSTRPVTVTPDINGDFTVDLYETGDLLGGGWYKLSIDQLAGSYTWPDFPSWKIRVPAGGGALAGMIDTGTPGAANGLVWIGDDPPADSSFIYWINTSVFPPKFNIGS